MKEILVKGFQFNRFVLAAFVATLAAGVFMAAQERPPAPPTAPAPPLTPPGAAPYTKPEHRPVGTLPPAAKLPTTTHPLVWDSMEKSMPASAADNKVEFSFWVTNSSKLDVIINTVTVGCGCTTTKLPPMPWKLAPGTNGEIKASIDLKGKSGNISKTLTVMSTAGHQVLTMKVNIGKDPVAAMAERQANMERAKADHQAVFKGDCMKCHFTPAAGKMGEPLFAAVCAVCHAPEDWAVARGEPPTSHHRADFVPDLAKLDHELSRKSLKITIANGTGRSGALMPAFSQRNGGPLTDEQIESLVEYISKTYKYNPANAKKTASALK